MKPILSTVLLLAALPIASFGQKQEIKELQRDIALMGDEVRTLQRLLNERLPALTALMQQSLESANKANTSAAVTERGLGDRLDRLERSMAAPMANATAKMEQVTAEMQAVRTEVSDISGRMSKLQAQLTDVSNAVNGMQAGRPAPPPPGGAGSGAAAPPPGMTAETLYSNAFRDKQAGNLDLALQQFNDYLRFYPNTDYASNAQFYIGEVSMNKSDYDTALKAFDAVLAYPENNKTPDAIFMKGRTLARMGQRTMAAEQYRTLVRRFPRSELSAKASSELRAMGLTANEASSSRPGRRR